MVKSLIRGLSGWPSADLAELLVAIKRILDARASHTGHGVEAELKARAKKQKADGRKS